MAPDAQTIEPAWPRTVVQRTTTRAADRAFDAPPALEATDLVFKHHGRSAPTIARTTLSVQTGERVLIQGASGER